MDRRQQKTREAIFEAFSTLLSSKSYTKITIQEIIDRANVGRSTFYSHFETKDDLLREMCTELFDHVFSEHLDMENTHDFSLANGDPASLITHNPVPSAG
ncbi:MAG: TetR/AcrR family transcriptional regulator [Faecalispora jeddahensis]